MGVAGYVALRGWKNANGRQTSEGAGGKVQLRVELYCSQWCMGQTL